MRTSYSFVGKLTLFCALLFPCLATAESAMNLIPTNSFYVSGQVGTAQKRFNQSYNDLTSTIPQNTTTEVTQNGYTGGIAVGYSRLVKSLYLLGLEFAGNASSNNANYKNGSTGFLFSDKTRMTYNLDLMFVPGVLLTDTVSAYLKLGISWAWIKDQLSAPVGFIPITNVPVATDKTVQGFVAGLGLKKYISQKIHVFAEYDYYDYGNNNFSNFTNFTARYTHNGHIYASKAVAGLTYSFA